jgi:hypothetical protein
VACDAEPEPLGYASTRDVVDGDMRLERVQAQLVSRAIEEELDCFGGVPTPTRCLPKPVTHLAEPCAPIHVVQAHLAEELFGRSFPHAVDKALAPFAVAGKIDDGGSDLSRVPVRHQRGAAG